MEPLDQPKTARKENEDRAAGLTAVTAAHLQVLDGPSLDSKDLHSLPDIASQTEPIHASHEVLFACSLSQSVLGAATMRLPILPMHLAEDHEDTSITLNVMTPTNVCLFLLAKMLKHVKTILDGTVCAH